MARDMTCIRKLAANHWEIRMRYTDPLTNTGKIYKKRLHGSADDAIALRDKARVAFRDGRHPDERETARQLRHYVKSYLKSMLTRGQKGKAVSINTAERHQRALDNHVLPAAGDWVMGAVRRRHVEELLEDWSQKKNKSGERYAPSTVNTWLKVMRQFMRHVYALEELGPSPVEDVTPLALTHTKNERTCLTVEEAALLLKTLAGEDRWAHYYPMVLLGLSTGARHSELSALHWDDIDTDRKVIRLHHSQNKGRRKAGTKTNKRKTFPLLPEIEAALTEHRQRMIAEQHPALATGIVFPARVRPENAKHGCYMQRWTLRGVLEKVCEVAEVPRITPHDFRVFLDTRLLVAGVHPELVRAMTGHDTEAMTEHYAHVSPEDKAIHLVPLMGGLMGTKSNDDGTNSGTIVEPENA